MPLPRADCLALLVGVALLVTALPAAGGAAVADSRADRPAVAATTGGAAPTAPHAPAEATLATDTGATTAGNVTVTNVTAWNVTVWSAPRAAADRLTNRSAIRTARRGNLLTRDYAMAFRDTLVMELSAPGLDERMAAASGANRTERFLDVLYDGDSHLTLVQTAAFLERDRYAAQLTRSSLTVVPAERAETYYLVVDPGDLRIGKCVTACGDSGETPIDTDPSRGPRLSPRDLSSGATLAVNLTVDGESTLVRKDRNGDPVPILRFERAAPEFVPATGYPHVLHPSSTEQIRARTHLARGTAVTIRITDRSDGGPSLSTTTTVVDGLNPRVPEGRIEMDNRIEASLDTSELPPGTTFELRAVAGGDVLWREPTVIERPPIVTNLTVWTAPSATADRLGTRAAIRSARGDGILTRDETVVWTDALVLGLTVPGMDARVEAASGTNATERFLAAAYDGDTHLTLWELNPAMESRPMAAQFTNGSTRVVPGAGEDAYYLVVEPEKLRVGICGTVCGSDADGPLDGPTETDRLRYAGAFALNATVDGNSTTLRRADGEPAPALRFESADADFLEEGGRDRIAFHDDPAPVRIETSLAPGSEVTIRLTNRSDGGPPLSTTIPVTVGSPADDWDDFDFEHGAIAHMNSSGLAADATFDLAVVADGEVLARSEGVVRRGSAATDGPGVTSTVGTGPGTPTSTESPSRARDTSTGAGPGFGISSGLVAVLMLALAGRARRQ